MANNSIRAEGKPKIAMYAMLLPSISNLILDYVFIYVLDMGMYGAAWATTISYIVCALYILLFFVSGGSELKLKIIDLKLKKSIVQQISSLGIVTLVRQAMVSVTVLLLNNILFELGGESIVAVYAIISRMLMFATFPILGITQGFLPIAGFNFGAKKFERVKEVISVSFKYATILAVFISILILIWVFKELTFFSINNQELLSFIWLQISWCKVSLFQIDQWNKARLCAQSSAVCSLP